MDPQSCSLLADPWLSLLCDWEMLDLVPRWAILSLLIGLPAGYVVEAARYGFLLGKRNTLHLAPISAKGKILAEMGTGGVALALRAELVSITDVLQSVLGNRAAPYFAPAAGRDTGYYLVGLRQEAPIPTKLREQQELRVQQEIVLKIGTMSIPISDLANTFAALLGAILIPFRTRYRNSTIKVSMAASGEQTRLTVHLAGEYAGDLSVFSWVKAVVTWVKRVLTSNVDPPTQPVVFTATRTTRTLKETNELIRDAAFMILHIHGSFKGRDWRSMRFLLDGIGKLNEYRRTGTATARNQAKECFHRAAVADPTNNHEALYYHGVMTMVDRTAEAIGEAQRYFETALSATSQPQLRALLHTGLAYCYAQQFHRLAKLNPEVLDKGTYHAREAEREWHLAQAERSTPAQLHPLIPYTYALVSHVDEGSKETHQKRLDRFVQAARRYRQAIDLQNDNGMFYNNLAWVLLKLAEWGEEVLPPGLDLNLDPGKGASDQKVAPLAEQYFQRALGLNPHNKLSHSNLCLLYSTRWFREHPEKSFLRRCRYHGLKAITLDANYINGHRDLAVALVRYGELDEAYEFYTKALELAEHPDKDEEIHRDLVQEVETYQERSRKRVSKKEWKRWREPDEWLFQPRSHSRPPAHREPDAGTASDSSDPKRLGDSD